MAGTERIKAFLEGQAGISGMEGWVSDLTKEALRFVSASDKPVPTTVFEFTCGKGHANFFGNLHGGCCATLFDYCTSTALLLITDDGIWKFAGVSRTLNVTYIRPVPVGTVVLIESEVVHAGKRLATVRGVMKRKSDGMIVALCEHGKANPDSSTNSKL